MKEHPGNDKPIQYFHPNQVIFRVEHDSTLDRASLEKLVYSEIARLAGRAIRTPAEAILTFPLGEEITSSLVFTRMADDQASSDDLLAFLRMLYDKFKDYASDPGQPVIRDFSPNWLMSSAQRQVGLGGPGAPPAEADPPGLDQWKFKLQDRQNTETLLPYKADIVEEVHIAILDTLPCAHDLASAYFEWVANRPNDPHPLLKGLFGPSGALGTYPADFDDLIRLESLLLRDNLYPMPDHGLFVAGIIHSIAPAAKLHLYEVLNPYGVGDLQTITNGLVKAINNPLVQGHKLVINLSLVLNLAYEEEVSQDEKPAHPRKYAEPDFPTILLEDKEFLDFLTRPARDFIALITGTGIPVVAAAGNDARRNNGNPDQTVRPPSRFPAAFDQVIGVGALPETYPHDANGKFKTASYSNLSDNPTMVGYATIGGEPESSTKKDKKGILGVFISDFPQAQVAQLSNQVGSKSNASGWAWWFGTSFATPIISGLIASWLSQSADFQRMLDDVSIVGGTKDNEKVVRVIQRT